MGLWDKLKKARGYARKQRGPDSYFQYKRKRDDERRDAERGREQVRDYAERERVESERGHEYEERYAAEGEGDPPHDSPRQSNQQEEQTEEGHQGEEQEAEQADEAKRDAESEGMTDQPRRGESERDQGDTEADNAPGRA
jgi:hypothetical protein